MYLKHVYFHVESLFKWKKILENSHFIILYKINLTKKDKFDRFSRKIDYKRLQIDVNKKENLRLNS